MRTDSLIVVREPSDYVASRPQTLGVICSNDLCPSLVLCCDWLKMTSQICLDCEKKLPFAQRGSRDVVKERIVVGYRYQIPRKNFMQTFSILFY